MQAENWIVTLPTPYNTTKYYECSSRTDEGVEAVFRDAILLGLRSWRFNVKKRICLLLWDAANLINTQTPSSKTWFLNLHCPVACAVRTNVYSLILNREHAFFSRIYWADSVHGFMCTDPTRHMQRSTARQPQSFPALIVLTCFILRSCLNFQTFVSTFRLIEQILNEKTSKRWFGGGKKSLKLGRATTASWLVCRITV